MRYGKRIFLVLLLIALFSGGPSFAEYLPGLGRANFDSINEIDWTPLAHGQMAIIYKSLIDGEEYATLHDIIFEGPNVSEADADSSFRFSVRYKGLSPENEADGVVGHWGYVFKKYPNVYIKIIPRISSAFFLIDKYWLYLGIDNCEDGINGNETAPGSRANVDCLTDESVIRPQSKSEFDK